VIVEQSAAMPLTCGDSWLHVSQLDAIVLGDRPRLALPADPDPGVFPASDHGIAANLKTLVRDAATIQLGLGKRTTAAMMLGAFDDANDLGYFGELTVPGTIERARRGIITSKYAEVHPRRFVSCNMGNSFEDLDTIEGNPFFELHSYEHTNDPSVIARHDDMLAVNCALGIDLTGQIAVYALGPAVYTGLGGPLAFHIGAFLSKRGRAVTLIPSTAKGGKTSTIVPQFGPGQIVSIPRELADTIVTEHGVAQLLGKSVRERAEALCEVSHPDYRDWLRSEARRLFHP
jgi:acyl-CoA hydrolase